MRWLHTQAPNATHNATASRAPISPPGLMSQVVAFSPRVEPPRSEWFLAGTEQALLRLNETENTADEQAKARILSPSNGTIVALDPDIPPRHQQLALLSEAPGLRWRIGGKVVARGASAQWAPWPGVHQIELVDASGKVADAVRVEVRGAGLRAAIVR
jgi:penicillin-binding protein 1C